MCEFVGMARAVHSHLDHTGEDLPPFESSEANRAERTKGTVRMKTRNWSRTVAATAVLVVVSLWVVVPLPAAEADEEIGVSGTHLAADLKYVPGEVLVRFKSDSAKAGGAGTRTEEAALWRLRTNHRLDVLKSIDLVARGQGRQRRRRALHVLKADGDVPAICERLRDDPDVEFAQPNYIYRPCRMPNDPDFADQYAHQLIQMADAWDISTGSRDVVVGVLGTGVDITHPDLKDNIWLNSGEIPDNGIDDDGNGYTDDVHGWNFESQNNEVAPTSAPNEIEGHETMVAGVIAAVGDNGQGVCGVNWQCSIMPLRVSIYITTAEVAESLDYAAANGAHIVNMSFGAGIDEPDWAGDPIMQEAIDNAFAQGVLLVASAGNSATDEVFYPAAYYNVMSVASTDGEDAKTDHSTFGAWVDIAAPGTDIVTTDLNGEYIATAGTSFSAPYVAAVAALVLAHRPELTHVELRAILENTADPVYYGSVDSDAGYIGTGRVNAYRALQAADRKYPLGEIATPRQAESLAADIETVDVLLFVHGDGYRLEYSTYASGDWAVAAEGAGSTEPNEFVRLSLPSPGPGTYELKLTVTRDGIAHTDRKVVAIEAAPSQAPWPTPTTVPYPPNDQFYSGPICIDVDGDGRNEIIQSSIAWDTTWGDPRLAIWREDGTALPGWPQLLSFAYDPPFCAVGDIDGDGDYEIVGTCNYDGIVCAWHAESGDDVDGWPKALGGWYGSIVGYPVLADLDGDGDSEIIIGLDYQSADTFALHALQGDGTPLWQRRYICEAAISAADFDGDGDIEIAFCGYGPGVSNLYTYLFDHQGQLIARWRGGSGKGTAIADLDGDGQCELIFCTEDGVQAVGIDGSTIWKTRIGDGFDTAGGLSVTDVDDDGRSEVFVNSYAQADGYSFTRVHALDYQGQPITEAEFPKIVIGDPGHSAPLIADIDGDGQKEILVGTAGAALMAWELDGSIVTGFPMLTLPTEIDCTITIADLDQDGDVEILVGGYDYRFHVVDMPGQADPDTADWSAARHDPQNSAWAAMIPTLDLSEAPQEIRPGQRLSLELRASNPEDRPLRFIVGSLPEGASFDESTRIVSWKPTAAQAFRTYRFSFLVTDGIHQTSRSVAITVIPDAIYAADMDTDPNWQLDEGWAWGAPTGGGSWHGDPNSGYTGQTVIGYALDGDYEDNLDETRYATIGPIDCQGYANIRLGFWRWLGVESPYDRACVQVSNDSVNWIDLWIGGNSQISDNSWRFVEYLVPASIGDGQSTLHFRWGIGPTDDSVTYAGWNVDDVQITGDSID